MLAQLMGHSMMYAEKQESLVTCVMSRWKELGAWRGTRIHNIRHLLREAQRKDSWAKQLELPHARTGQDGKKCKYTSDLSRAIFLNCAPSPFHLTSHTM